MDWIVWDASKVDDESAWEEAEQSEGDNVLAWIGVNCIIKGDCTLQEGVAAASWERQKKIWIFWYSQLTDSKGVNERDIGIDTSGFT